MSSHAEVAALSEDQMYERIVSAILDHRLPPGTKLVEDRLASTFGVSRTRVRPVLVRLANEQVVTLTPNRGATVSQPTEKEAREVFEARRLIEPRLVELFVQNASAAAVARLRALTDSEEAARTAGDHRRTVGLSGQFHLAIAEGAGHQTLGRVLRELVSRTSLVVMAYSPAQAAERDLAAACGCREHHALIDAIRLGDAKEAMRRMVDHLQRIEDQLVFTVVDEPAADLGELLRA
jgi:DNA-binding GntR family transcriptional regulator